MPNDSRRTSTDAEVDVLITAYNADRYLAAAIESIQKQTLEHWRLIVVDDCSTDNTPRILERFCAQDSRILALKGRHQGIAAAANRGLEKCTAPYIARLDADDIALPHRLALQKDYLDANPNTLAIGTDVQLIDESAKPIRLRRVPYSHEAVLKTLGTRNCIYHPSCMIRAGDLREIGGYREQFRNSEDYDLWLRMSERGNLANLPNVATLYRKHDTQVTSKANTHRLTLYSVAAALDYFVRRYGVPAEPVTIDEGNNDSISRGLAQLYSLDLDPMDLLAINRHAMRLLRQANALGAQARLELTQRMLPRLSLLERIKHQLYSVVKA